MERDAKGRFRAVEKASPTSEEINAIVAAFAEAVAPPIPEARRWRWAVWLNISAALVAGCLIGLSAKERELRPRLHALGSALASAVHAGSALAETSADLRRQVGELQSENARLWLAHGGAVQQLYQMRDTDQGAVRDLKRADRALQYDQSVDRISDRAKTWVALRAVQKAEKRLNEQP